MLGETIDVLPPSGLPNTFQHYESYPAERKFPGQFKIDFSCPHIKLFYVFNNSYHVVFYDRQSIRVVIACVVLFISGRSLTSNS